MRTGLAWRLRVTLDQVSNVASIRQSKHISNHCFRHWKLTTFLRILHLQQAPMAFTALIILRATSLKRPERTEENDWNEPALLDAELFERESKTISLNPCPVLL
jgi:hypothetical protein